MKKVALYLVHPEFENESRINKALINAVKELDNVNVYNLYEKYPQFNIDVKAEQEILLQNDVILFQFPLFWFGSPSLLKEWFDQILETNFAYGEHFALENKKFAIATTAGGAAQNYRNLGFTVEEFLKPFHGTANYIKMQYQQPFVVHNTFVLSDEELAVITDNYVQYIKELSQ